MDEDVPRNSFNPGDVGSFRVSSERTPLQQDKVKDEGLKYIITTFTSATVLITIALAVSLSQKSTNISLGGGIVSDRKACTDVGEDILVSGGNAVDAAVAVTFCLGVVLPHLTGIGGNGLILIYNQRSSKPVLCLDSWSHKEGPLPKLLLALHSAHDRYGRKTWADLIEPSIKLARDGFTVAESLSQSKVLLESYASKNLSQWLSKLEVGISITSPRLAATLSSIQREGHGTFYKGKLGEDLQDFYGSLDDLELNETPCIESFVDGYHVVSSGMGSGGPFLQQVLSSEKLSWNSTINNLIQIFEGKDESSWSFPSGVVVATSDNSDTYVSIVSGLGPALGSQELSVNGYIFGKNIEMPPPLGSIGTALVISDQLSPCKKRIISGGVDSRDLLEVIPPLLWSDGDLQTVVESPRVRFSEGGPLSEASHAPSYPSPLPPAPLPYPSINVIQITDDTVLTYSDSRSGI